MAAYARFRRSLGKALVAAAGSTVVVGALTWASVPPMKQLVAGGALGYEAALGAITAAVAWLVVLWLTCCLALTLVSRLPTAVGRCAGRMARLITPVLVRRLLEAGLGTTLVVAGGAYATDATNAATLSGTANGADSAGAGAHATERPAPPRPDRPARTREPDRARPGVVRVRAGDTLWDIAAAELPGQPNNQAIADAWPRWYAANRAVIGPDPDLILPGQRLRVPAP